MKVLCVLHAFLPESIGGLELHVYRLAKEVLKRHQVKIFCRGGDLSKEEYLTEDLTYEGIEIRRINYAWRDFNGFKMTYINENIHKEFEKFLDSYQPDIVDIHHLACLSASIIQSIKERNIPLVLTLHDYWMMCPKGQRVKDDDLVLCESIDRRICSSCMREAFGPSPRSFISRLLNRFRQNTPRKAFTDYDRYMSKMLNLPDIIITPGDFHRKEFIRYGVLPERIKTIPNGQEREVLRKVKKSPANKVRFGFMGSVIPTKGVHILVEAFNKFDRDDVSLSIYGPVVPFHGDNSYGDRLNKMIEPGKDVTFYGRYENKDVVDILANIDVLVVPSIWYECSPIVIREGLLAGIPVLASNIGGMKESVEHEKNGLHFECGSPRDLFEKMKMLVEDRTLRERLSNCDVKEKSIQEHGVVMEKLYTKLVAERANLGESF
jgi:glycosyltransferase involved in cell wall biosynthesis